MDWKNLVEVLLFAAPEPLTQNRLNHVLQDEDSIKLGPLVDELNAEYIETGKGLKIMQIAGGYQILSDKEYQQMRNWSILCLRTIGVDTGGSNVQFAVNPDNGRTIIIEMNPRVSRSSALASKATGFPIAKIAAKLAIGTQTIAK